MPLTALVKSRSSLKVAAIAAAFALTLAVGGCSAFVAPGPTLDGWPIGPPVDCVADAQRCSKLIDVAEQGFDAQSQHVPIRSIRLYDQPNLQARSGGPILVAVITLTDGSMHAVGVGTYGLGRLAAFGASGATLIEVEDP